MPFDLLFDNPQGRTCKYTHYLNKIEIKKPHRISNEI